MNYCLNEYLTNRISNQTLLNVMLGNRDLFDLEDCFSPDFEQAVKDFSLKVGYEKQSSTYNRKINSLFNKSLINYADFFYRYATDEQFFQAVVISMTYNSLLILPVNETPNELFSHYTESINRNMDKIRSFLNSD